MQLDSTRITVRERGYFDTFDLALRVIRASGWRLAVALAAGVDWLEAGTPLILAEGLHGVRALRQRFPKTPIVADLKGCRGLGSADIGAG